MISDEEDEKPPHHEYRCADLLPPYQFEYSLKYHYEVPQDASELSGRILHGEEPVGSIKGMLIDRDIQSYSFYLICDMDSAELHHISVELCDTIGRVRKSQVDGISDENMMKASYGGFLHIEEVKIKREHRGQDVGIRFLHRMLTWMNEDGVLRRSEGPLKRCNWTLAAIVPSTLSSDTRHMSKEQVASAERKIALQFARLGFKQVTSGSDCWYLTPSGLRLYTKTHVAGLVIKEQPK